MPTEIHHHVCLMLPVILFWLIAPATFLLTHRWNILTPYIPRIGMEGNGVTVFECIRYTILQHLFFSWLNYQLLDTSAPLFDPIESWTMKIFKFTLCMIGADLCFSATHFVLHITPTIQQLTHGWHHLVRYTHVFASIYDHPIERILENLGVFFTFKFVGTDLATSTAFVCFITMKGIADHSNVWTPFNMIFENNSEYHGKHHWSKADENLQQPFWTFWDRALGTYGGGYYKHPRNKRRSREYELRVKTICGTNFLMSPNGKKPVFAKKEQRPEFYSPKGTFRESNWSDCNSESKSSD